MPKLPDNFLNTLPLKSNLNRHTLWQEIVLDINLRRDNADQVSFLNKRVSEIINKLKKEGGNFILFMANEGKINPYSTSSFEEQFVNFFSDYDFAMKMFHEAEPHIIKVEQVRKNYSGRPACVIDKKILSICKELYDLPMFKDYVNILPYLQHLDNINTILEKLKHNRPIVNYIPKDGLVEKFIKDQIKSFSTEGWKSFFLDEGDYNLFCDLLVRYFEKGDCQLPDVIIQLHSGYATKLAKHVKPILKKFSKVMRRAHGFYDIFRLLDDFKNMEDEKIYDIIRK